MVTYRIINLSVIILSKTLYWNLFINLLINHIRNSGREHGYAHVIIRLC